MEDLIEFYDARDQILNRQDYLGKHEIHEGLRRFKLCCNMKGLSSAQLEEACFISQLFEHVQATYLGYVEIKRVLLVKADDFSLKSTLRSVAICYASLILGYNEGLCKRACEMGNAHAMGVMSQYYLALPTSFDLLLLSAQNGDRVGLRCLAYYYEYGIGCDIDTPRAMSLYKQAALLHDSEAMYIYAYKAFKKDDPCRYLWLGRAAQRGKFYSTLKTFSYNQNIESGLFMKEAVIHLTDYDNGKGCGPVLFMIGKMCKSFLPKFGLSKEDRLVGYKIVNLYEDSCESARDATFCWILCAKRLGLYKDVSLLIGRLVWERRDTFTCMNNAILIP